MTTSVNVSVGGRYNRTVTVIAGDGTRGEPVIVGPNGSYPVPAPSESFTLEFSSEAQVADETVVAADDDGKPKAEGDDNGGD